MKLKRLMCELLSSDVPPETPSTSRAAAGQTEASQSGSQAEASAEANTSTAGTAPQSAAQPHSGFNTTVVMNISVKLQLNPVICVSITALLTNVNRH